MATPSKILIAPLDWGLGHTTRCIPLIRHLLASGHEVYAAAEGASARLLSENFPGLPMIPLTGYRIQYSQKRRWFMLKIMSQVPAILRSISREHRWLKTLQQQYHFDLVLSDNRYGLYHKDVHSVILTHQLQIRSGSGAFADGILRRLHYRMLRRFDACWVVDDEAGSGYSGILAHPLERPANSTYTGLLSQFNTPGDAEKNAPLSNRILALLSGPEPMRSQLEAIVMQQAAQLPDYDFVVVGGNPLGVPPAGSVHNIRYHTHLPASALLPELLAASLVICRSGYSTVMDLAVLGCRALLVPTPGQSEQEYLAQYLAQQGYFHTTTQEALKLQRQIPSSLSSYARPAKPGPSQIGSLLDTILKDKR